MSDAAAINGFTLTHAAIHATQGTGISSIERLVLTTLSSFANVLSECWPANSTLADRTGLHERTVGKAIGKLQEKGLIERSSRGQGRAMLTRILIPITPPAHGLPPPAHGLPEPVFEPTILKTVAAPLETIEPCTETATPIFFVSEIQQQPIPAIQEIDSLPDYSAQLQVFANSQYAPTEAPTESPVPLQDQAPAIPTLDTNQATQDPVIEADPVEAAWAEVPAQVLLDLMEIRKFKKKAPKPTKTEIKHWYSIALESGFTLAQIAYVMVLRGWGGGIADASWLQHVPRPQLQPGTGTPAAPAAPKVWEPEPYTPASPSTVATWREKIAAMKKKWNEEPLRQ